MDDAAGQRKRFDSVYSSANRGRWEFHYTKDPLTRYLRDRRLRLALRYVASAAAVSMAEMRTWRALIVCGGVGGEGTFLANQGFADVTVSDFSANSLALCKVFDSRLETLQADAEALDLDAGSYDLVLVQDGLHHLPRPMLGFTEMLRVSRRAVVVIEPYLSLAGRLMGTEWERAGDAVNYVFRWNQQMLEEATRSYLLSERTHVKAHRVWDHNMRVGRAVRKLPQPFRMKAAQFAYLGLTVLLPRMGNMMVGVVVKDDAGPAKRLVGHA